MAEKSTIRLPALSGLGSVARGQPSLDEARGALGGRIRSDGRAGQGAVVLDPRRGRCDGVVLCATDRELDVWIGEGLIARVPIAEAASSLTPEPLERFAEVATDIRRYWSMSEGDEVRVLGPGEPFDGILREQCRYGALVERPKGGSRVVVAVGFRRMARVGVSLATLKGPSGPSRPA